MLARESGKGKVSPSLLPFSCRNTAPAFSSQLGNAALALGLVGMDEHGGGDKIPRSSGARRNRSRERFCQSYGKNKYGVGVW